MKNQNIFLKPITLESEENMLDILTSDIVNRYYMLPDFTRREDAIPLFQKLINLSMDKKRYVRGIYLEKELIGFMNDVEVINGSIELGYVIHPAFHGRGYMTMALKTAISELFTMDYQEVITGAFDENVASIRVMEKSGMSLMEKAEEIEYRGKEYHCIYYHIKKNW